MAYSGVTENEGNATKLLKGMVGAPDPYRVNSCQARVSSMKTTRAIFLQQNSHCSHCIHCFNCTFGTFLCAKLCAQSYTPQLIIERSFMSKKPGLPSISGPDIRNVAKRLALKIDVWNPVSSIGGIFRKHAGLEQWCGHDEV